MFTTVFPVFAFGMPSASELMIVLVIVFVFFGAGRLPDVLKQFGKGMRQFKDASDGVDKGLLSRAAEDDEDDEDDEQAALEEFRRARQMAKRIGRDSADPGPDVAGVRPESLPASRTR